MQTIRLPGQTTGDANPQLIGEGSNPASRTMVSNPTSYSVSVAQLSIPAKALKHLESAEKRFRKMDWPGAAIEIDRVLEIDPDCSQALTMRALVRLASNNSIGAAADAERAVVLDSDDALSFLALATAYNSQDEFERAETAARQALKIRPDLWQARLEIAKSFYGRQQFAAALRELDAERTDFPDVHLVRGNVLMRLGRGHEGAEEFSRFLGEAPHDPRAGKIRKIVADVARDPSVRF